MAKALPLIAGAASAVAPAVAAAAPALGSALGGVGTALGGAGAGAASAAGAAGAGGMLGSMSPAIAQGLSSLGPMGNIAGAAMNGTLTPGVVLEQGMKQLMGGMKQAAAQGQQDQSSMASQDPAEQAMRDLLQRRANYDPSQLQQVIGQRSKFGR